MDLDVRMERYLMHKLYEELKNFKVTTFLYDHAVKDSEIVTGECTYADLRNFFYYHANNKPEQYKKLLDRLENWEEKIALMYS